MVTVFFALSLSRFFCFLRLFLQNAKWWRREKRRIFFPNCILYDYYYSFKFHVTFFFIWIIILVKWIHEHWKCLQFLVKIMGQLSVNRRAEEQKQKIKCSMTPLWWKLKLIPFHGCKRSKQLQRKNPEMDTLQLKEKIISRDEKECLHRIERALKREHIILIVELNVMNKVYGVVTLLMMPLSMLLSV